MISVEHLKFQVYMYLFSTSRENNQNLLKSTISRYMYIISGGRE